MAIGDDATAAGMPLVPANGAVGSPGKVRQGPQEFNRGRDFIAQGPVNWKPGVVLPIAKGGTGAITPAAARTALGIPVWDIYATPDTLICRAPDGLFAVAPALYPTNPVQKSQMDAAIAGAIAAISGYLPTSGGTMTGHLFSPPARSTPVNTSYVAAYLNADGRLGATPSALKYKRDIEDYDGSALHLHPVTYILKDDERETRRLGIIADEANDHEPMLVIHEDGEVESFKYELLAVALLRDVQRLAARVAELEARS